VRRVRWFGIFALVGATVSASAAIKPAGDTLLTTRWKNTIRSADNLKLPVPTSPGPKQALVYIYAGANYTEALALSGNPAKAEGLARAFESAFSGTPVASSTVEYAQEDGQAVATVDHSKSVLGARSGGREIDVPRLMAAVRSAGLTPCVLVRLPLYGTVDASGFQTDESTRSRYLYATGDQATSRVRFSVTLSDRAIPIAVLALLLPLLGGLGGLLGGMAVARNMSIELKRRRQLYGRVVNGCVFGGISIHAPLFVGLTISRAYLPYVDVWFGTRSLANFIPVFVLTPILLFAILPITNRAERKLFGPPPESPALPSPPVPSEHQKRVRRAATAIYFVLAAAALGLMFVLPAGFRAVPLAFVLFGNVIFQSAILPKLGAPTAIASVDDLQSLQLIAESYGRQLGVSVGKVERDKSQFTTSMCSLTAGIRRNIVVSDRFRQLMGEQEARFHIAAAVAAISLGHPVKRAAMIAGPALLMMLYMIVTMRFLFQSPQRVPIAFAPLILFLPFAFLVIRPAMTRMVAEADRQALKLTGDFPSARSAVLKLFGIAPERDDAETANPFATRRIADLERASRELGLVSTPRGTSS